MTGPQTEALWTGEPLTLKLADILVPDQRLRVLRPSVVAEIAASIAEVGLLNPISVTPGGKLVAGQHRLEACRILGWAEIPAVVVEVDDELKLRLAEVDENLVRADLTALERGEHVAERKRVYELLHPEAANPAKVAAAARWNDAGETVSPASFTADTAAKTGLDRRTIQLDVQVGSLPAPVRDAIRETPVADRKRDLIELARMPPAKQAAVAEVIRNGSPTVAAAQAALDPDSPEANGAAAWDEEEVDGDADEVVVVAAGPEVPVSQTADYDGDAWSTPDNIIAAAREVMGSIDLDPATNTFAQERICATRFYTQQDDGLARSWAGRVWLNPPYSAPEPFTTKAVEEYDAGKVVSAIILVNNATETAWFQALLSRFPACFFSGRISFLFRGEEGKGARQGQVAFYLGDDEDVFRSVFGGLGVVMVRA